MPCRLDAKDPLGFSSQNWSSAARTPVRGLVDYPGDLGVLDDNPRNRAGALSIEFWTLW